MKTKNADFSYTIICVICLILVSLICIHSIKYAYKDKIKQAYHKGYTMGRGFLK